MGIFCVLELPANFQLFAFSKLKGVQNRVLETVLTRVPFLERPGNFSGPKSYFKNHEAFYVQSFLCQQVVHLSKAYTYAAFRI